MNVTKSERILEADIHGLTAEDAKRRLEHLLSSAPPDVT